MLKFYHFIFICLFNFFLCAVALAETIDYQEQLIRVGISSSNFESLEYPSTTLTADNNFVLTDLASEKLLINAKPGQVFKISVSGKGFNIMSNGQYIFSNIEGPIGVSSVSGYIKLLDIKRKGGIPAYRGRFEIVRGCSSPSKLSVVNVLKLDDYLKGVVPNELPISFGFEALKAQAVAARNYAVRPREKTYPQFDICDSVMCQVYFGYYTERPLSNKAVSETAGLMALYKGDVITALYSSAPGGCTENYEFAFSEPQTKVFPSEPRPYLKAKCDISSFKDLSSEKAARDFYMNHHSTFDAKSGYHRWERSWTRTELENVINYNLAKLSEAKQSKDFIVPAFNKNDSIGTLMDIKVLKRGISGKAMYLEITGTKGTWVVKKELNIRRLLTKDGSALPSANIILNRLTDASGNIAGIKLFGGGFGHGVGMSQYGASYMSGKGYTFDRILQHYYNGVAIGTEPVFLPADDSYKPVKQVFYMPYTKAYLIVENEGVDSLKLNLNGRELALKKEIENKCNIKVDISNYLKTGFNEVVYYPPASDLSEGLSVKMWIEVVETK